MMFAYSIPRRVATIILDKDTHISLGADEPNIKWIHVHTKAGSTLTNFNFSKIRTDIKRELGATNIKKLKAIFKKHLDGDVLKRSKMALVEKEIIGELK